MKAHINQQAARPLALLYGLPVALTMGEVAIGELGAVFLGMVLLTVLKSRVDFNKISKM